MDLSDLNGFLATFVDNGVMNMKLVNMIAGNWMV